MSKPMKNFKLLTVCLAVVILSLAGAWGIRMVLAEWPGPDFDPPDGMPPGPVWLQLVTPGIVQSGYINLAGARLGAIAAGTYDIDSDYNITAPKIYGGEICLGDPVDCRTEWPSGGEGGLPVIVGATASGYDGSQGGYEGANGYCFNEFGEGSHVCTTDEILTTFNQGINIFSLPNIDADNYYWTSAGVPFPSWDVTMNDCYGWTENGASYGGIVWHLVNAGEKTTYVDYCSTFNKFLCCK